MPLRPGAVLVASILAVGVTVQAAGAQTPVLPTAFEAASVKPNKSDAPIGPGGNMSGPNYAAVNVPLLMLIRQAYQVQGFQIVGGPSWINSERFDIVAKTSIAAVQGHVVMSLLQSLLADRFKLAIHKETRTLPVYALVMARGDGKPGPQFHQPAVDCYAVLRANFDAATPLPSGFFCGGMKPGPGELSGRMATMKQLAEFLSPQVGRIVLDVTGVTDPFDMDLTWTPGLAVSDASGTSVYTALQEELGLRLDSQQGPVEVIVIDHVERPTEN